MIAQTMCLAILAIDTNNKRLQHNLGAASVFSTSVIHALDSCSEDEWSCLEGSCIALSLRCNGVVDCVDGSDEDEAYCQKNKMPQNGTCYLPEYPAHGTYITNIPNAKPGEAYDLVTINVICREGFLADGFNSTFCFYGQWQHKMPKCVSGCHLPRHDSVEYQCLVSGAVEGSRICNEYEPSGTVVSPQCRTPIYYSPTALQYMRCKNGQWDYVAICIPECGTMTSRGTPLVAGGEPARRGDLPWHAGVYDKYNKYLQICGGTLISTDAVISAAHCFWSNYLDTMQPAGRYAVAVGKLYRAWDEAEDDKQGAQRSDVKEIHLPARFQGSVANFQDDIAVLIVTDPFKYTPFIRPVCLDFDAVFERRQLQPGNLGKVAGWGLVGPHSKDFLVLKVIDLQCVSTGTCISESPPSFRPLITSDKICACFKDASKAICKCDTGHGLLFPEFDKGIQRYYLRGIVSSAPRSTNSYCTFKSNIAFTRIQSHEHFIKRFWVAAGYQSDVKEYGNKDEDPEDKNHPYYGHIVVKTMTKFSPEFKHPTKPEHQISALEGIIETASAQGEPEHYSIYAVIMLTFINISMFAIIVFHTLNYKHINCFNVFGTNSKRP